jgi:hypothetical protein
MPSEFFNPADHLLDLVSIDPRISQYDQSLDRVHGLTDQWRAKQHTKESGEEGGISSETTVIKRGEGTTSMKVAFPVVLERTWKNLWRKKDVSLYQIRAVGDADEVGVFQSTTTAALAWWTIYPFLPASE